MTTTKRCLPFLKKNRWANNITVKHHKPNDQSGGAVIAAGGFGCLFAPHLRCSRHATLKSTGPNTQMPKHNRQSKTQKQITKLMLTKNAEYEFDLIVQFKKVLKHIPNYGKYFILDNITLCRPAKMTANDLKNFKQKCSALQKRRISVPSEVQHELALTAKPKSSDSSSSSPLTSLQTENRTIRISADNINHPYIRRQLKMLHMPFGGEPVDDYIQNAFNNNTSFSSFSSSFSSSSSSSSSFKQHITQLHSKLTELYHCAIKEMNKRHVYHCDLKDANVLVLMEDNHLFVRIIDQGLAILDNPTKHKSPPENLRGRSLQYNLPYSTILFNKTFNSFVEQQIAPLAQEVAPNRIEVHVLRPLITAFINEWFEVRGEGHIAFVHEIEENVNANTTSVTAVTNQTTNNHELKKQILEHEPIVTYLLNIVREFMTTTTTAFMTTKYVFDMQQYYRNVFLPSVDLWGFICVYYSLVQCVNTQAVRDAYQHLLVNVLYKNACTPIPENDMLTGLDALVTAALSNEV